MSGSPTYAVTFEGETGQPEWDRFVSENHGHHAQTSTWANVKGSLGWRGIRLVVRDGERIVGGAQVLARDVGPLGRIGTCAHGPIAVGDDPKLFEVLHEGLLELGRNESIRYLKVQPPQGRDDLAASLRERRWTPSALSAAPSATVRVNLSDPEEQILARMRQSTRNTIRQGTKRGLVLREGGIDDFPAYHRVIEATGKRQGFTPYPPEYFELLWEEFSARDGACLMLAELDDDVLSVTLVIACGETATCKLGGWSGQKSRVSPNQPMHFAVMRWAKENGIRYYDFDGIDRETAVAVLEDGPMPEGHKNSVAAFKLGFGCEAVLMPETLDIGPGPVLRPVVRVAAPRLAGLLPVAHRIAGRGQ